MTEQHQPPRHRAPDGLIEWLRALLDGLADSHKRLVLAEGQNPDHEREADPDGVWAVLDAHREILESCAATLDPGWPASHAYEAAEHLAVKNLCALALAYQHADGYREEWRP